MKIKRIFCLFLAPLLIVLCLLPVFAEQTEEKSGAAVVSDSSAAKEKAEENKNAVILKNPLLSPGLSVLAARSTMIRSAAAGKEIVFTSADFENTLGYTPSEITVTALPDPAMGVLKLGALDLIAGQSVSARALSGLRFLPRTGDVPAETAFSFTASGGAYISDAERVCRLCMTDGENGAPKGRDASFAAFCEIPFTAVLYAADPEADALSFSVVRAPRKGSVSLNPETGAFLYTPDEGKKGNDSFTYRVTDRYGGESAVCTVKLKIKKPVSDVRYDDLSGHWAEGAAAAVTEAGLMCGETVGGVHLFSPDKPVSRIEFLVTAMHAAGWDAIPARTRTVFADDEDIPSYYRDAAAYAYEKGIVTGASVDESGMPVLEPLRTVTRAEAAVMLGRLLGEEAEENVYPVFASFEGEEAIPAWSLGAVRVLRGAGILSGTGESMSMEAPLDRAQSAQLLAMTLSYLQN